MSGYVEAIILITECGAAQWGRNNNVGAQPSCASFVRCLVRSLLLLRRPVQTLFLQLLLLSHSAEYKMRRKQGEIYPHLKPLPHPFILTLLFLGWNHFDFNTFSCLRTTSYIRLQSPIVFGGLKVWWARLQGHIIESSPWPVQSTSECVRWTN